MDYGEVLSKAWKIIWKFKILWLFGILAGCGSAGGNSGSSSTGYRGSGRGGSISPEINQFFNNIGNNLQNIPVWVWVLLAGAFFVLFVMVIFLNTIGRIGIIAGASEADQGATSLPLGHLFNASLSFFWRVFLLNFLFGIVILVLVLVVTVPLILLTVATFGIGLICLLPFICLLIPLSWLVNIYLEQSIIAIVVEKAGIFEGLAMGWNVLKRNPGQIIIMGLILLIGGGIIGLIIALPVALIVLPVIFGLMLGGGAMNASLIVSALLFIIYLPILLLLTGILRSYTGTAWALTFLRLTGRGISAPGLVQVSPLPPPDPLSAS